MPKRRIKNDDNAKKRKVWTVLFVLVICAVALAARGIFIYRIFPLEYKDEIAKHSNTYAIDEYFVCAVISTESGFDAQAVSPKGAVGLMQIMPNTGEWAADKMSVPDYTTDKLSNPDINIQIGCWYLNYLSTKFGGDARKVLAAYNAGPANVEQWLDDNGALIDIPFEETENYLIKVQRNYEIYKSIYNEF